MAITDPVLVNLFGITFLPDHVNRLARGHSFTPASPSIKSSEQGGNVSPIMALDLDS